MKQKTVIIIMGATASGKTKRSIQLASQYNTSIISADSRQCFKELNIGVAKPTAEELSSVKHYFINSHSIHDVVNAQVFENYALNAVEEIFKKNDVAVMAGGTGMYIKAFCEGLDEIPTVDAALREQIIQSYHENGIEWLQSEIRKNDPLFWKQAEQKNPQRMMRALEVLKTTGKSIITFQKKKQISRPFNIKKIGIQLSKEQLHFNINNRVDEMVRAGLVDEVKSLLPYRNLNPLQTVGYSEIFEYLDGKISLEQSIEKIKTNTRQYAKRQRTWFKKDDEINWETAKRN
ncbi:MAG: tRNA (adenosine(37)-N6)-dimethylallyltransferase MiaA [Bacteroidetes bacterium]|nr:tRNA (adenosine(37)-N6)-dimethylallyltransferase MiaA [Bacteroidota bacterium]